ncbi:sugar phosphate isomerase/epimerase [Limnoglobus roseus]|uniref:Sugar phosphate isomerase/epimerase n=2 Tax=Limnoglobus roseus TaxID=2598579 RepID=A0A5C1A5H3_9BACT|nr:sugar phosphate isomerase/epimerase [Limnoglobus roseus]
MKIGMNLLLWTGHVTEEHYPLLAKIKAAGYDGVELPLFEGDPSHFKKVKTELDKQGLKCTTVTVVNPEHSPISPDASIRKAAHERHKWAIDCSAALGAETMLGPFHSPLGVFTGDGPTADEKKRAAEVLRQAAEYAKQANLMLAIEYLNRFECYFLTTAADAVALVKSVDHPNFRTMYDTFHANIEEVRPSTAIRTISPVLAHVHISENNRGTPGTGQVNWFETFRSLREVGYDGWLTIEAFGRALPALAAATRVWRDFFPSPDHVYTEGIGFIQSMWKLAKV